MIVTKTLLVCLLCLSPALAQNSCETNRLNDVKSGRVRARGVNLGSWLILESWMAGNVWTDNGCNANDSPGSYLLEKCLGDRAESVMQQHWSTWITENDFITMSQHGINVARVPVGWWHIYDPQGGANNADLNQYVDPKDFVVGGLDYLDQAFEWGRKHGIAILVDLHAAPGSQNGNDHSAPANPGVINWDKYDANIAQSVDSMELYAERYANHEALYGFAPLNEPAQIDNGKLRDYYQRAYSAIRKHSPDSYIIINPLINPFESGIEGHWTNFMNPDQGFTKVAMDLHYYSCFGGSGDTTNADQNINYIIYDRRAQIAEYQNNNPKLMFIGEWSACHHGDYNRAANFLRAEVEVYGEASLGWTFWSWKVPGNGEWSLQDAINSNWIGNFDQPC